MDVGVNKAVISTLGDMIAGQLPWGLRAGPGGPDKALPPPAPGRPPVQLLAPMQLWNWPVAVVGTVSSEQQMLVDAVPMSSAGSAPFYASGTSFSESYHDFLSLVDLPAFALPSRLSSILAICKAPVEAPTVAPSAPDGWVKVPDGSGLLRWRLGYVVSDTPSNWSAGNGAERQPLALSFPVDDRTSLTAFDAAGNGHELALARDSVIAVGVNACGRVDVVPGAWYDGTVLSLAKAGPFVKEVTDPGIAGSMLGARVASLIVADKPVLTLSLSAAQLAVTRDALESAAAIRFGGFTFRQCSKVPAPAGASTDGATYTAAAGPGPWIIGVVLQTFS